MDIAHTTQETLGLVKESLTKAVTLATGLTAYDLQAPAKNLYPIITPLRNALPRVGRTNPGDAARWRTISSIAGSGFDAMGWVPEGQRTASMSYSAALQVAPYLTLGEEDSVTFEAEAAAQGFEDIDSTATLRPVEARDQSQIELYGMRVGSTIQAHEICDEINVGPIVAQTILQRQLYVRAHYAFKLSWEYCLLDPMDVVTINDANLGLSACPVRIVSIEEDDKGLLAVTAEELTIGVSTPALYPNASTSSAVPNRGVTPDSVNTPLIYEPPAALTGGAAQIWVGASGGANGVADPNWGGANVWLSLDDVSYSQITTIAQPLRQGQLTAALPSASGWDTADTLKVNLVESGAALSGATAAAAQQGATRSLVDGEILAYESATLTGAYAYALTGLQRGLYGTAGAAHAAGAPFARLDQAVVAYDLPANFIGQTLFFKFQSFNLFGAGLQDLSTCAAYPFTPLGVGVGAPIAAQLAGGVPLDLGAVAAAPALADDFGALIGAVSGALDLGLA
jgi:hypothetical protein